MSKNDVFFVFFSDYKLYETNRTSHEANSHRNNHLNDSYIEEVFRIGSKKKKAILKKLRYSTPNDVNENHPLKIHIHIYLVIKMR